MFEALFEFFLGIFHNNLTQFGTLYYVLTDNVSVGDKTLPLDVYLSFILSLISIITIIVLCCLFIYKIIKLFGRLFSGGTL